MNPEEQQRLAGDMRQFPAPVLDEFSAALPRIQDLLSDEEFTSWANEGLSVAKQSVRSWEAAAAYFHASPDVVRLLSFGSFMQWARAGGYLSADSPVVAAAFYRASVAMVAHLRPQYIPKWASLGHGLYKGTWKSSGLAARFFEVSPTLAKALPFWELELLVQLVESLSYKSYDVAMDCLGVAQDVLPGMGREREAFLSLSRTLSETSWREVKHLMEAAPQSLLVVDEDQRARLLRLAERVVRTGATGAAEFLLDASQALGKAPGGHRQVLDLCELALPLAPGSVPAFLHSLPGVLSRVTLTQLPAWFQQGLSLLQENQEAGLAYFRVESTASEGALETLSSAVALDRVRDVLRMYCRALAGAQMEIQDTKDLVDSNIGWVNEDHATTEGSRVFLPPIVDRYKSKRQNFDWFKVVSTHQVGHLEFGSFEFQFEGPSMLFRDMRTGLERRRGKAAGAGAPPPVPEAAPQGEPGAEEGARRMTEIGRFFTLFDERKLALDLFTVLEDTRLDARLRMEYPGMAPVYRAVQGEAASHRPDMKTLPLREGFVEFLLRLSLGQLKGLPVPEEYLRESRLLARLSRRLTKPEAEVEDSAEATLRAYEILMRIPNKQEQQEQFQDQDFDQDEEEYSDDELEDVLREMGEPSNTEEGTGEGEGEEGEEPYESPEDVDFRGDFKPELTQLLTKLRQDQGKGDTQSVSLSREELEELLKQTAELELDPEAGQMNPDLAAFATNMMKEAGMTPPSKTDPGQGQGPLVHEDEQGGALEVREPKAYAYDEWDFRAVDYKPKWCIVREKPLDEGDHVFFQDTLHAYAGLMADIRRQFELAVPEAFRKVKRLPDGEDLDFDQTVEAHIDRLSRVPPSEKIYWRRNKVQRDVAVAFLLDMSASTAEAIDDGHRVFDDQDAPDDPVEYMLWLRTRRDSSVRRQYKRIIDIEKESVVLLIQALETIGDVYGIYGFSGYGRENVEFFVIKDLEERFGESVKKRIDKITPLHATRMGPAIRHTITKLHRQDARTKLLFLISDGRPQDRGYSREGVEREYAVHDTKMALVEARRLNIQPFCLTVDKAGHDYLKTMCGDLGYEVLPDIAQLPKRLPQLYKRLTI